VHHIFGSDELSVHTSGVAQRSPKPYVMLNKKAAAVLKVAGGAQLSFDIGKQHFSLPVELNDTIADGIIGVPYGLPGMTCIDLPATITVKTNG
jgi:NADH-quinone oxidoreductase subunit G